MTIQSVIIGSVLEEEKYHIKPVPLYCLSYSYYYYKCYFSFLELLQILKVSKGKPLETAAAGFTG